MTPSQYRNMRDCAAYGCEASVDSGDVLLRISPKGFKFVGLCREHAQRGGLVFKQEAAELMAEEPTP